MRTDPGRAESVERRELIGDVIPYSTSSEAATVFSKESDLFSLETGSNYRRNPAPIWKLATLAAEMDHNQNI